MNIFDAMTEAPTMKEASTRSASEKMWSEFDFFYENGEPHFFNLENGVSVTFGSNRRISAWTLSINHELVLTDSDTNKIVEKALEYTNPIS
jgi:hypothetical protein